MSGSIYYSGHSGLSPIYIKNITITKNELNTINKIGLFYFGGSDKTNISNINIKYSYNANTSCQFYQNVVNTRLNESGDIITMKCINPVMAINNFGQMKMDNITIDIDISNMTNNMNNHRYYLIQFLYENRYHTEEHALIKNDGKMNITNMFITESLSHYLLLNTGDLSIYNLSFDPTKNINYNVNALRSRSIIFQFGFDASLFIYHSHFIGSYIQIHLNSGKIKIIDSLFENCRQSINIYTVNEFVMSNCTIKNDDQYNGVYIDTVKYPPFPIPHMQIRFSNNIILFNNNFFGYSGDGLLIIQQSSNVSLINNTFKMNTSVESSWSPLTFISCSNTKIISNHFEKHLLYPTRAWLSYYENKETNCLSGNTFRNYAFYTYLTNITSCIDKEIGNFIVDMNHNIPSIFTLYDSNLVLDNINITVINVNNNSNRINVLMDNSNLLLLDSYITMTHSAIYDISYYGSVEKNVFIPQSSIISLIINDCPVGFGAISYNLLLINNVNSTKLSQCAAKQQTSDHLNYQYQYLYILLFLLIIVIIYYCCCYYMNTKDDKVFIVNKSLVLIIGIAKFDDRKLFNPDVPENIVDLEKLWRDKYHYDVFVCNKHTFYSTKRDVEMFIDNKTNRIKNGDYQSVIIHIISPGLDCGIFTCSDGKKIKFDFIREKIEHIGLIKLLFHHGCKQSADYNNNDENISCDSNLVIISGNIKHRTIWDTPQFTKCVCHSFGKNIDKIWKSDFNSLLVEINSNLKRTTTTGELCNVKGTFSFNSIIFEKCKHKKKKKVLNQWLIDDAKINEHNGISHNDVKLKSSNM